MNTNIDAASLNTNKSLWYIFYLYLWPFWLFENVNAGSFLERTAAYRRNREKRYYLPGYAVKWLIIYIVLVTLISILEAMGNTCAGCKLSFVLLAGGAGILAILAFLVVVLTIAAYMLLSQWDQY